MNGVATTAGRPVTTMPLVRVQEHGRKGGVDVLACGHTLQVSPFGNYSRSRRCPMCPPKAPCQPRDEHVMHLRRVLRQMTDALEGEHGGGADNRHPACYVCRLIAGGRREQQ